MHQARGRVVSYQAVSAAPAASRIGWHRSERQFTERLGRPVLRCVGKLNWAVGFVWLAVRCNAWVSVSIGYFGLGAVQGLCRVNILGSVGVGV